jgi:mRNA interferase RelE/StbE
MYRTEWEQDARSGLRKLDVSVAHRVLLKIDWLKANFDNVRHEALTGAFKGYLKLVIGDYRVIYSVARSNKVIIIRAVGHRSSVYKTN